MIEQEVVVNEVNTSTTTYSVIVYPDIENLVQVQEVTNTISTVETTDVIQQIDSTGVVTTSDETYVVGDSFVQGPAGPPGPDYYTIIASEDLPEYAQVNIQGQLGNDPFLGVSIAPATVGSETRVKQHGFLDNVNWSWVPNIAIFALDNGVLTQTPPISGTLSIIGFAVSGQKIFIRPEPTILLS